MLSLRETREEMMAIFHQHFLLLLAILVTAEAMVNAFFTSNNIVPMRHAAGSRRDRTTSQDVLLRSTNYESSSSDDQSFDTTSSPSTSIGDITQNLHGGKYQFSETQYLAGGSLMGQQFAESLYSSCNEEEGVEEEDDELPKWALIMQQPDEHEGKQLAGSMTFSECAKSHTISITNDERSWEKYYSFVLPNTFQQSFRISSMRGILAPRGGASNACDASKPYSDSAHITVELIGDDHASIVGGEVLLVVGTEAEIWRYELNVE